jgi:hypothetical protein
MHFDFEPHPVPVSDWRADWCGVVRGQVINLLSDDTLPYVAIMRRGMRAEKACTSYASALGMSRWCMRMIVNADDRVCCQTGEKSHDLRMLRK